MKSDMCNVYTVGRLSVNEAQKIVTYHRVSYQ